MAEKLTQNEIEGWVAAHPKWSFRDGALRKKFVFRSFRDAIIFVNRVATIADEMNHHPDIDVRYNVVALGLSTHDAGGVTELDVKWAERIDFATSAR